MNSLLEHFDSLTTREKIIFLVTIAIVILGAWDTLFYQPITSSSSQVKTELSTVKNLLSEQKQTAAQIISLGKIDPNQANAEKLKQVKSNLKKLKSQLGIGEKSFVSAHLMLDVLSDMLKQSSGLILVSLESLPVTSLSKSNEENSGVYRHGLSITLSGTYLNTLNYLKSLETLPWKFSWDTIGYQVKEYPIAETTLQIYTLSFEEHWLDL